MRWYPGLPPEPKPPPRPETAEERIDRRHVAGAWMGAQALAALAGTLFAVEHVSPGAAGAGVTFAFFALVATVVAVFLEWVTYGPDA